MSEFPVYEVTVRIWTEYGHTYREPRGLLREANLVAIADTESEARANHAVACADVGLANVWPVSEGRVTIATDHAITDWVTSARSIFGTPPYSTSIVKYYWWPTEADLATILAQRRPVGRQPRKQAPA